MKALYIFLLATVMTACLKNTKEEAPITVCPSPATLAWLSAKKAEYSPCTCLTGARQGIYQDQPVIEIYLYDPRCNGINVVFKVDGSTWFTSSEAIYADYSANVKEQRNIWTCTDGDE